MSQATSPQTGRRYGLQRVCGAWLLPRSTWYAQTAAIRPERPAPLKRGPKTALSDAELAEAIRGVLATSPFLAKYGTTIDRESAHERITGRIATARAAVSPSARDGSSSRSEME